jgi:CelD/BcsL family acetyltransferase involved in cellulose biosynthesis
VPITKLPAAGLTAGCKIATVDPITDVRWNALLSLEAAGLFHSPPWLRALSVTYSFKMQAHVATDAANVVRGGVAFCEMADVFGRRVVSSPFCDTCDPLLESSQWWPTLFACLQKHELPVYLRCVEDHTAQGDPRVTVIKRARWHTLQVNGDIDAVWDGLEGPARRAIRKARRGDVTVRLLEGADSPAKFHRLHVALRKRKYRLLAQPLSFFEAVKECFEKIDGWFPMGAFVDGQLVAATIYLRWGDTLYYKFNASGDSLELRPNNLLVWAGIELAQSLGCRKLDLGPSDDDQRGLIRFKQQFGAREREVRFLRYLPPGWPDHQSAELHRLLGELTRLLTSPDATDELTAQAGALLYRFFA